MKYFLVTFICSILTISNLMSDDHVISYGMEGYQCNYKDDVSFDNLVSFTKDDLNPYADKNWPVPYNGFYLTPFLRSGDEVSFDVGWVGFTNNHKDMGIVQDSWFSDDASDTFAKWDSLTECSSQGYYMAIEARTPQVQFVEGENTFWAIRSCSLNEGKQSKTYYLVIKRGMNIWINLAIPAESGDGHLLREHLMRLKVTSC